MNKYQKALNTIMCETCHIGEVGKPIQVIKELVDKETPMKTNGSNCGKCDIHLAKTMPYVFQYTISNYCPNCSQKIDWSEDNEL